MKFVHVTDTHLVARPGKLCALDPARRLECAIERVNQMDGDAEFMVITGDLSYHGMEPAYRTMRALLSGLSMPCHLLIGNHDDRDSFKRVFPDTPVDPNGFVQYVVETDSGAFVMLDTVADGRSPGELCERRLAWLEDILAKYRDTPVFLFLHHPPFSVGVGSLDSCMLEEPEKLGRLLDAHGDVRHIFYGHVHRPIAGSWRGIPATTLPGTNHQVGLYLGPEPDMLGTHEPPAYGVCLINDESIVVHMRNFLDESPRFLLENKASQAAIRPDDLVPPAAAYHGLA